MGPTVDGTVIFLTITIIFIVCMFLAWYFSHRAKHEERMLMIDKGLEPDDRLKEVKGRSFPWLKMGVVLIGLSVGLGLNGILISRNMLGNSNAIAFAILGLSGGISLIIANFINNKKGQ